MMRVVPVYTIPYTPYTLATPALQHDACGAGVYYTLYPIHPLPSPHLLRSMMRLVPVTASGDLAAIWRATCATAPAIKHSALRSDRRADQAIGIIDRRADQIDR